MKKLIITALLALSLLLSSCRQTDMVKSYWNQCQDITTCVYNADTLNGK